jgi:hypothetical protein
MQTHPSPLARKRGTILVACTVLVICIIVACITAYIIIQLCKLLPPVDGHGGHTNVVQQVTVTLPDVTGSNACNGFAAKSLDRTYRLVLQRRVGTNDWDDLLGMDWSGQPGTFHVETNWTEVLTLFRVKAIPTGK